MPPRRVSRNPPISQEILASIPDGRGGQIMIRAASGQIHTSRRPRARIVARWLEENPGITDSGLLCWSDTIDVARAPTARLSFDAGRRDRKLFDGRVDVGLCHRVCFLLVGLGVEDSWRTRSPVVVFWGRRTGTRRQLWDVYLLGDNAAQLADNLASVLGTSGAGHGLAIDTLNAKVPVGGSMAPLLRWDGASVGMYNRDGVEVDRIFAGVGQGRKLPRLEVRLGFPKGGTVRRSANELGSRRPGRKQRSVAR